MTRTASDVTVHLDLNDDGDNALPCEKAVFLRLAQDALTTSGRLPSVIREVTISVACVNRRQMQVQNMRLRGVDAPTDVLSQGHFSDSVDIRDVDIPHIFLGEVILCYTQIVRYAHEDGTVPREALYTAFVHGVLHLMGFSHGAEMFRLQRDVAMRAMQNVKNE